MEGNCRVPCDMLSIEARLKKASLGWPGSRIKMDRGEVCECCEVMSCAKERSLSLGTQALVEDEIIKPSTLKRWLTGPMDEFCSSIHLYADVCSMHHLYPCHAYPRTPNT